MKFNRRQMDGIAKLADNLATANLIALIIGGVVDQKLSHGSVVVLAALTTMLIFLGLKLRKDGGPDAD